ncbi:MAG: hypothetical protein ACLGSH_11150 [Acidobacteriota bacterium]
MNLRRIGIAVLAALCLFFAQSTLAQVQPAVNGHAAKADSSTWNLFLGGSFARSAPQNAYGWDSAVSEYPYRSLHWIGGTIEASGHYYNKSGASTQLYTVMGGPSAALRSRAVQPFARFLLGGIVNRVSAGGQALTSDHFGLAVGGGVDWPVSSRAAIRTQGDWIPYWVQSQREDVFRASAGFAFKF